ncbi:hypothetical protein GN244_ATG13768 [Phytophthora infestans]|uniref:Uncharacterized protein n=1 Tax=Phytophthora infestans TaxID=4787 RepID=A0A833SJB5_PHYIN|nr:hypothetical protein GN244_ATG13768 [Phytophthora infestans]
MLVRSVVRSLQRGSPRLFSSAAAVETKPKGPPFARYFWYTTGIMLGIPGAIGGVFVYNLQTDDEFYNHFNDRYPDLIDTINEYVPLNESLLELAKREDIGPIGSTEDLINETVTVVAELQSGHKVKFDVLGSAISQAENDRVVNVTFAEEGDDAKDKKAVAPTAQEAWPPAPRVTWGSAAVAQKSKKPVDSAKELRLQIEEIRAQQAALEESKYAGRDIDEADEEIAVLEARKIELKEQLPRKRFLWIF